MGTGLTVEDLNAQPIGTVWVSQREAFIKVTQSHKGWRSLKGHGAMFTDSICYVSGHVVWSLS